MYSLQDRRKVCQCRIRPLEASLLLCFSVACAYLPGAPSRPKIQVVGCDRLSGPVHAVGQ